MLSILFNNDDNCDFRIINTEIHENKFPSIILKKKPFFTFKKKKKQKIN